jgi:hypothetical protein
MVSHTTAFALSALTVGWFFAPLLQPASSPGSLDEIASWAMRGPGVEIPTPLMGVFVFKGLNPAFLADMSYAHSWDAKERSFVFGMGGPGLYVLESATPAAFSGEFANKSPAPPKSGAFVRALMRLLRHSNKFIMNEEGTRADIHPIFFFEGFPLAWLARAMLREQIELHKGPLPVFGTTRWKRTNFSPASNSTPTDAHYWLHPVVTRRKDGSLKVHGRGLRMAKRKLQMAGGSRFVH